MKLSRKLDPGGPAEMTGTRKSLMWDGRYYLLAGNPSLSGALDLLVVVFELSVLVGDRGGRWRVPTRFWGPVNLIHRGQPVTAPLQLITCLLQKKSIGASPPPALPAPVQLGTPKGSTLAVPVLCSAQLHERNLCLCVYIP